MDKTNEEFDWDLTSLFQTEEERITAVQSFNQAIKE